MRYSKLPTKVTVSKNRVIMASTATAASSSLVDAHLEMDPGDAIAFTLTVQEATPRVTLTLRHPDPDSAPVAFKVITYHTNYVSNNTIERKSERCSTVTHEYGFSCGAKMLQLRYLHDFGFAC
jgi:hypothetical protein